MLFLLLVSAVNGSRPDANAWLYEMVERLALTVRTHGRYPCVFGDYRDLVAHPRERTDDYRREATPGSILIPVLAAFLVALGNQDALKQLIELKANELQHCTLQLWTPDKSSEEAIYLSASDHGVAICDLPLSLTGKELFKTLRDACSQTEGFDGLSAIATGFWPIILTACRYYNSPCRPSCGSTWSTLRKNPELNNSLNLAARPRCRPPAADTHAAGRATVRLKATASRSPRPSSPCPRARYAPWLHPSAHRRG